MTISKLTGVIIEVICCALPNNKHDIHSVAGKYFSKRDLDKIVEHIGIQNLYYSKEGQTVSDLAYAASEELIKKIGWVREEIDGIVFVTQTSDYILPATACVLQDKLNLKKDIIAFDMNLGCSGFIYGMNLVSQYISSQTCSKLLLVVGDTITKKISPEDKSTSVIFSDGVSVTAVSKNESTNKLSYILKSDGGGHNNLIIPAGGFKQPLDEESKKVYVDEDGNKRSEENLYMNGMEIFGFAVREIPKILREILDIHDITVDEVDDFILHQANNYMLKYIAKKTKIPSEKVPTNIESFGNTGGASIPMIICDKLKDKVLKENYNVVMCGFGVGLSWGALAMNIGKMKYVDIIYVE